MTRRTRHPHPDQISLLDWTPSEPVKAFAPETIRAASLAARYSKGMSAAMKQCGQPRSRLADRMSDYLGEPIGENMLNAYASEARGDHIINIVRFTGLMEATGDQQRLLQMLAEPFGFVVIDRKYLPAIRYAQKMERRAEMDKDIEFERRLMKSGGII